MHHEFWQDRWTRNEIGFHQDSINQYLVDFWSTLSPSGNESVLVPLCGKSHDILWLNQKGHAVLGVELSDMACRDFFLESKLNATVTPGSPFTTYIHDDIQLWCGDFFALSPQDTAHCKLIFDRAALIALPSETRQLYAAQLKSLTQNGAKILLVTMEYPQAEMDGPPFSVPSEEVHQLFQSHFTIRHLHTQELGRDDPFAKRKGLSQLQEHVFILQRSTGKSTESGLL
ncbi:MAG: thiopurine S-methyltransferase [Hahellaceae bacterium]|nr:thiopurine S-methyltransferase [Hahellaceae bacterium]MCP5168703.1 thiopurine S-methyltransferase [Hahellaceae bacterium]